MKSTVSKRISLNSQSTNRGVTSTVRHIVSHNYLLLLSTLLFILVVMSLHFAKSRIVIRSTDLRINYQVKWFKTKVDHFGFKNNDKFWLRYLHSDEHFKAGGPIFFYAGNEGPITSFARNTGFMWEFAPKFEATIIFAEHRYYGESLPYKNVTEDKNMLNYLTVEQAMADYIDLLSTLFPGRKVIAFGGSYGGMLAAWLRQKYPNFITGALAASAPVYQFENLSDCSGPNKIITRRFKEYYEHSPTNIRGMWDILKTLSPDELRQLWKNIRLCDHEMNVSTFTDFFVGMLFNVAMVNYPTAANLFVPLPPFPAKTIAELFSKKSMLLDDYAESLYQSINVYFNHTGNVNECFTLSNVNGNIPDYMWDYQYCTEMSMYLCSDDSGSNMFPVRPYNKSGDVQSCLNEYGVVPDPSWIPKEFNVEGMSSFSNIIFSNGEFDPWMSGGVLKDINERVVSIFIYGGAHHSDLRTSSKYDSQSLIDARKMEVSLIQKWLRD